MAEHPVFIFGYGLGDPNVTDIIADLGEILCEDGGVIENIFYVEWNPNAANGVPLREEYLIAASRAELRVRAITADEFGWVFDAIAAKSPLKWVDPRVVRMLASRFHTIIRKDIPKTVVEVDFKQLSSVAESSDILPKVLGIGNSISPNATHPYTLTEVAKKLKYGSWHRAHKLIDIIKDDKNINIQDGDNLYHCAIKSGRGMFRRYSEDAVELLKMVKDGKKYDVKLDG